MNKKSKKRYLNSCGYNKNEGKTHFCEFCLEKEDIISNLREELLSVKAALRHRKKTETISIPGTHTPSSQIQKSNSDIESKKRKGGAKKGHTGSGRRSGIKTHDSYSFPHPKKCPCCNINLSFKDTKSRTIVDVEKMKAKRILHTLERGQCPKCKKIYQPSLECFPKNLYGNRLISQALIMHYVHGLPIGRLLKVLGPEVTEGGLIQVFHRLAEIFGKSKEKILHEFKTAEVKHADETTWRIDGQSGYAWIFATDRVSWFEFTNTRAATVPRKIFGEEMHNGVLLVDRYGGYNKLPVKIQYCFAHLLREVKKLEKEFPDSKEVAWFVDKFSKCLSDAMRLRGLNLTKKEHIRRGTIIQDKMFAEIDYPYEHLGIIRIQHIFDSKQHRMYHWISNPKVPAENNLAEREIRPTVIARKTSFGSQSRKGAKTRAQIISYLFTAKKRLKEKESIDDWLFSILNKLSIDSALDTYDLLPS